MCRICSVWVPDVDACEIAAGIAAGMMRCVKLKAVGAVHAQT